MSTARTSKDLCFDKRVMPRYLREGKISHEEVKKHLDSLPDRAEDGEDIADKIFEERVSSVEQEQTTSNDDA